MFRVRNVPAALYKALGGFATNGVNMTKLESYQTEGTFNATMFFADIEGHPVDRAVQPRARGAVVLLDRAVKVLGTYPASPYRREAAERAAGRLACGSSCVVWCVAEARPGCGSGVRSPS